MKGKRYADIDAIQKSFDNHPDRANRCIQTNKMFAKENQFFFFIKS